MNKQPFYHRAVILFTATREIQESEVLAALSQKFKVPGLVKDSIEIDEIDAEPGDPADLM